MSEKRFTLRAIIITAAVTAVLTLGAVALTAWFQLGPGGLAMLQSMGLVRGRFVGSYDQEAVTDAALSALVEALDDRWSLYLTAEDYAEMNQRRENAYVGVGLIYQASEERDAMVILSLTPGGPAQRGGLREGERIVAVDGQALTPETFEQVADSIAGAPGKEVVFTVEDAQGARREVTLALEQVENVVVEERMLEDGMGYIHLSNFYQNSARKTLEAVERLEEQGAKGILFDMRSNPGGYVSELTELLDGLLGEGPIFAEHSKNGPVKVTRSDARCVDLPMAVLVNADSYSAAELFAAQLRESVDAPIIGQPTCGKGYYQQALPLVNGGALNLSTGMYTTGGGVSLIGTGLTPDAVEDDPEVQLRRGMELLRERMG